MPVAVFTITARRPPGRSARFARSPVRTPCCWANAPSILCAITV
jgi:hypothetical protein